MACADVQKLIPGYVKHSISEDDASIVDGHLSVCSACRKFLSDHIDSVSENADQPKPEVSQPELVKPVAPVSRPPAAPKPDVVPPVLPTEPVQPVVPPPVRTSPVSKTQGQSGDSLDYLLLVVCVCLFLGLLFLLFSKK